MQSSLPSNTTQLVPFNLGVIRRNGSFTSFDASKITIAVTKAFLAVEGSTAANSGRVHDIAVALTVQVVAALTRRLADGGTVHIEDIQDQVELALMREGHHKVARAYVLYRDERTRQRTASEANEISVRTKLQMTLQDGRKATLDQTQLKQRVAAACVALTDVEVEPVIEETMRNVYDGITEADLDQALLMSARTLFEHEPNYGFVAARLLLDSLRHEALSFLEGHRLEVTQAEMSTLYPEYFGKYIRRAVELELLDPRLLEFDLERLGVALTAERDLFFNYIGLQTLYDRYFQHFEETRLELPQIFFMRVAMGLALNEIDREDRAIEFYHLLSSLDYMSSTPTLFNAGTRRPQLSSCYLTTVPDDLSGIYSAIRDNALLSKFAGGLGNDWTRVRALGSYIKGTNGKSQGVVPFMKVANDTAVAVNQGGKRKGAVCAYLETWHLDIEDFLDLRKNTGDERRRTHDMNTAHWIPDLFIQRVMEDGQWTLFSPDEVPDLHDLYGQAFTDAYVGYELKVERGELRNHKRVSAVQLWRRMLSMLFETGHPWMTFKEPCNLRSPQQHVGVVHSSNLCTEITLNTSDEEIAVCNLGSVNLVNHLNENGLNMNKLQRTVHTAIRMLDNVIDINYYSIPQARRSNLRHRPIGLGLMGFQDALHALRMPYASPEAVKFADLSAEALSYYAIQASADLAAERGPYPSFEGSLWDQGVLPIDSLQRLAKTRGQNGLEIDRSSTMDWDNLRERVKSGMRNSNCLAIAPTATIANITGVSASIEPTYQNLYVKSNLSGEFTMVNPYLVNDLKVLGLWDPVMVNDLKYYDGSLARIDRIPEDIKQLYATAFEIDPLWLVEAGARRQKWLDQAQSLNLYLGEPSGKKLDELYKLAWKRGLKSTYYLRTLGATHTEKNSDLEMQSAAVAKPKVCSIDNAECDVCQ